MQFPVHVTPTGGSVIVDADGRVIAIASGWAYAANIVEALNTSNIPSYRPRTVDGLECVPWIKKYREEKRCPLREAKDAWDARVGYVPGQ
jgi:hypothetical protein